MKVALTKVACYKEVYYCKLSGSSSLPHHSGMTFQMFCEN